MSTWRAFDSLRLLESASSLSREKDASAALGSRKAKAYRRMLARAKLSSSAVQFLPEVHAADNVAIGRESERVFRRIQHNVSRAPRARNRNSTNGVSGDASSSDDGLSDDSNDDNAQSMLPAAAADDAHATQAAPAGESSDDEEVRLSGRSTASSSDDDASAGAHSSTSSAVDEEFFDERTAEQEHKAKQWTRPGDAIASSLCRRPDEYAPPDFTAEREDETLDAEIGEEAIKHAIPGFAAMPHALSKSKGGEAFYNYLGRWNDGHMSGDGAYVFVDGARYRGAWEDSLPHGEGRAVYPDGSWYEGAWRHGVKHGQGVSVSPFGAEYRGQFDRGQRTGKAKLQLPSGTVYEGDFVKGRFHGRGKMTNKAGYEYSGNWAKGEVCGTGALVEPEGGRRTVRTWKPATFVDIIADMRDERQRRQHRRVRLQRNLRATMDDMNLQRHVRQLRDNIRQAEVDRIEAEREKMEKAKRDRREQLRKAKEDVLNGVGFEDEEVPEGTERGGEVGHGEEEEVGNGEEEEEDGEGDEESEGEEGDNEEGEDDQDDQTRH